MNVRIGIVLAALAIGGCGDNQKGAGGKGPEELARIAQEAKGWLAKNGHKQEEDGFKDALEKKNYEAITRYVQADKSAPYVGSYFARNVSQCKASTFVWLDADSCVKVTKAFVDGGMPLDYKFNEFTFESAARAMLDYKGLTPERMASIQALVKFIDTNKKK